MVAKLIVFEGPDQVGKGTQSHMLASAIRRAGARVALVQVPVADGLTHGLIYRMLKNGMARQFPNAFQLLNFVNKTFFQVRELPNLMKNNDVVILDRWSLSAIVYGDATSVNPRLNIAFFKLLQKPDATIVLVGPTRSRGADDAYEASTEIQTRVRNSYSIWAKDHEVDHVLIDFDGSKSDIHDYIVAELGDIVEIF